MIVDIIYASVAMLFAAFALIGAITVGEYVLDRLGERRRMRRLRTRLPLPLCRVVDTRARLDTMRTRRMPTIDAQWSVRS